MGEMMKKEEEREEKMHDTLRGRTWESGTS